jgi:hypothetical protein
MGAETFIDDVAGDDLRAAFAAARDDAAYYHGHGGYTGTIAEKSDVTLVDRAPTRADALDLARQLLADDDERVSDKWGPAGAIAYPGGFVLFGWASS